MVLEKGREAALFASFIELFITTPKSSGVGRGVSQRKSSVCVESDTTQQHKAGYKNFIFKSLSDTPFEKVDKRSQKAFHCLQ